MLYELYIPYVVNLVAIIDCWCAECCFSVVNQSKAHGVTRSSSINPIVLTGVLL